VIWTHPLSLIMQTLIHYYSSPFVYYSQSSVRSFLGPSVHWSHSHTTIGIRKVFCSCHCSLSWLSSVLLMYFI
jgi:hypothetical protein